MLGSKRRDVIPEQTVINIEGNWGYYSDPGDDVWDNETVTPAFEQTPEDHQSSVDIPDSSGGMERPNRNVRPPQCLDL